MKKFSSILIPLLASASLHAKSPSIYDFSMKDIDGKEVALSKYKGKVLLIVNTASQCAFTYQYEGLQKLYTKYKDKGFMVLGFPSNDFSEQEPGSDDEIKVFCVSHYKVDFDMFSKIEVNGDHVPKLYKFLKSEATGFMWTESIKWNFTKFLVDQKGEVITRYGSTTKPKNIDEDIEELLNKP